MKRKSSPGRRFARLLVGRLLPGVVILLLAAKGWSDWRWMRLYRPAQPAVHTQSRVPTNGFVREVFIMEGFHGAEIPVRAAVPDGGTRHPAIIFLYGAGMSMDFALQIDTPVTGAGFALFVPEQDRRGRRQRDQARAWQKAWGVRRRCFLTGPELRRLIDAVSLRPDVDPERIYFWGASFGAISGCHAAVRDPRIKAFLFTLAGGDFSSFIADSPVRAEAPRWAPPLAHVAAWLLAPLDPVHHVARIAPRPLLMQNTRADDLIPVSSVKALFAAAREPRELRWFDITHNHIRREEIQLLVKDGLEWFSGRDREISGALAACHPGTGARLCGTRSCK